MAKITITEIRTNAKSEIEKVKADHKALGKITDVFAKLKSRMGGDIEDGNWVLEVRDRNLAYDDNYYGDRDDMETKLRAMNSRYLKQIREVCPFVKIDNDISDEYGTCEFRVSEFKKLDEVIFGKFYNTMMKFVDYGGDADYKKVMGIVWIGRQYGLTRILVKGNNAEADAKRFISLAKIFKFTYEIEKVHVPYKPKSMWNSGEVQAHDEIWIVKK